MEAVAATSTCYFLQMLSYQTNEKLYQRVFDQSRAAQFVISRAVCVENTSCLTTSKTANKDDMHV